MRAPAPGRIRHAGGIQQREFDLPQCGKSGLEAARAQQLRDLFRRQPFAGFHVPGDVAQYLRLPGVVLEELAGQLDRIPGHAIDAGDGGVLHAREQVVQAVAELVEKRDHIVVRELRRPAIRAGQRIADQVGHGQGIAGVELLATHAVIHPCAAALVGPGVGSR